MASQQQCADALDQLADRLAEHADDGGSSAASTFTRTLSCSVRDLGIVYGARLDGGRLTDIRTVTDPGAQVRLVMTSDDLLALAAGELQLGSAWASGRVKVHAGVRDLLKLRTIF